MGKKTLLQEKRLTPDRLHHTVGPDSFDFESTADVSPLEGTIGQERALSAISAGLEMETPGFNIYAAGPVGTGRNSTLHAMVQDCAKKMPAPNDWCYVTNFEDKDRPLAIELPAGKARELEADMEEFIKECGEEIAKAFEAEEHAKQKSSAVQDLQAEHNQLLNQLDKRARDLDHTVRITPTGLATIPLVNGEPVNQEEFDKLDESTKEDLREKNKKLQELVAETMTQAKKLEKQTRQKSQEMDRDVALYAVGHLVDELADKYGDNEKLRHWLEQVKDDVVENVNLFRGNQQQQQQQAVAQMVGMKASAQKESGRNRYRVNVVVDHSQTDGAPVVDERNPTYYNLVGKLEYRMQFGGMTTDTMMIKAC